MPPEQWPHSYYPPFASGCGFVISHDLVAWLVGESADFTFFRVIDVPVGIYLACLPHVPQRGPTLAPALAPTLAPTLASTLAPHPGPTLVPCLGPDGRSASPGLRLAVLSAGPARRPPRASARA